MSQYLGYYNQVVTEDSPLAISLSTSMSGDQITLVAHVSVTGAIETTNNKIFLVLAHYKVDSNADYQYIVSGNSGAQTFPLTSVGETGNYSYTFTYDTSWALEDMKAVAFVQTYSEPNHVLQAAMVGFDQLTARFSADIQSGPADLIVHYTDSSVVPADLAITDWEWDLNGDGTVDSHDQNPTWTYTTEGTYDVSLTVHAGADSSSSVTTQDFITVTPNTAISGPVAGDWSPNHGTYTLNGDISVPSGLSLTIRPGTELVLASDMKITVTGKAMIGSSDGDPVRLWNAEGTTWRGITFLSATDSSVLDNCDITGTSQAAITIDSSPVQVLNCRIHGISTGAVPPAIDLSTADDVVIKGNLIANNTSTGNGGAICMLNSSPMIANNVIVNNQGVPTGAILVKNGSNPTLVNNTIANNLCNSTFNSAMFFYNAGGTLINSIIKGTGTNQIYCFNSTPTVTYSDISSGYTGEGNIQDDPLFLTPSAGDGPTFDGMAACWVLQSSSTCIDAGSPVADYNDAEDPDNAGSPLFPAQGTLRCDMGAFGGDGNSYYVGNDDPGTVPAPAALSLQIAPNPFNPNTTLYYTLNTPGRATMAIYNLRGEKVRTLLDAHSDAGTHSVNWNGLDDRGRPVGSGIYFGNFGVTSDIGGDRYTAIKKMILLK